MTGRPSSWTKPTARIQPFRFLRIPAAKIGPKRFHQNLIVSWLTSIPRSWRRSSTLRSDSGNRTYIITARRMISGEVLTVSEFQSSELFSETALSSQPGCPETAFYGLGRRHEVPT